jgi:hypothetical protein
MLAKKYATTDPKDIPIHLIIICGGTNLTFKQHLEKNVMPLTQLPMTVDLSFNEEKMEELMSMASYGGALVGKAGGATIFETFARGTRILVDNVSSGWFSQGITHFVITLFDSLLQKLGFEKQLRWEKANMNFAKKHGLSAIFRNEEDFLPQLMKVLDNNGFPVPLNLDIKSVEEEIPKALEQMLAKAQLDPNIRKIREVHKNL